MLPHMVRTIPPKKCCMQAARLRFGSCCWPTGESESVTDTPDVPLWSFGVSYQTGLSCAPCLQHAACEGLGCGLVKYGGSRLPLSLWTHTQADAFITPKSGLVSGLNGKHSLSLVSFHLSCSKKWLWARPRCRPARSPATKRREEVGGGGRGLQHDRYLRPTFSLTQPLRKLPSNAPLERSSSSCCTETQMNWFLY